MNRLRAAWQRLLQRLGLELDWSALGEDPAAQWCGTEWTVTAYDVDTLWQILPTTPRRSEVHACALEPEHDGPCICDCGTADKPRLRELLNTPCSWDTYNDFTGRNLL